MDYDTEPFRRLRRLQRRLLVHPLWQPSPATLSAAASLINARTAVAETVDAFEVAAMVYDTVAHTDPDEVRRAIAGLAGVPAADVEFEDVLVSVDGTNTRNAMGPRARRRHLAHPRPLTAHPDQRLLRELFCEQRVTAVQAQHRPGADARAGRRRRARRLARTRALPFVRVKRRSTWT